MRTRRLTLGKLLIRLHWPTALAVVLTAGGLVRLGLWQLDRAAEKIEQQQAFSGSAQAQATPLSQVPIAGINFDVLQHQNRLVQLHGSYLNERNIFLIYQQYEDQLGFEVVTPFRRADAEQTVLVSRGWSGISEIDALAAALPPITGEREIEGQLYIPTPEQAARHNPATNTDWPLLRRYINIDELQPLFDTELFPYVVRLTEGQQGLLVRHWPAASVDTGRHFSYALQWFAMAFAVLATALFLSSNIRQLIQSPDRH